MRLIAFNEKEKFNDDTITLIKQLAPSLADKNVFVMMMVTRDR
jgi:hypothetical protein